MSIVNKQLKPLLTMKLTNNTGGQNGARDLNNNPHEMGDDNAGNDGKQLVSAKATVQYTSLEVYRSKINTSSIF